MPRIDGDTWDLASSVGGTATWVAAGRALASKQPDPLINDPHADALVKATDLDFCNRMADGAIDFGSEIDATGLLYSGERDSARGHLAAHGWQVSRLSTVDAYAANGFMLPEDGLAEIAGPGYLTVTLGG